MLSASQVLCCHSTVGAPSVRRRGETDQQSVADLSFSPRQGGTLITPNYLLGKKIDKQGFFRMELPTESGERDRQRQQETEVGHAHTQPPVEQKANKAKVHSLTPCALPVPLDELLSERRRGLCCC